MATVLATHAIHVPSMPTRLADTEVERLAQHHHLAKPSSIQLLTDRRYELLARLTSAGGEFIVGYGLPNAQARDR